jgi:hypothetical protein
MRLSSFSSSKSPRYYLDTSCRCEFPADNCTRVSPTPDPPHHHSLALHTILSAKCRDLTPQYHSGFTPPLHTQLRVCRCICFAIRQLSPASDIVADDQKSFVAHQEATLRLSPLITPQWYFQNNSCDLSTHKQVVSAIERTLRRASTTAPPAGA